MNLNATKAKHQLRHSKALQCMASLSFPSLLETPACVAWCVVTADSRIAGLAETRINSRHSYASRCLAFSDI